jgi:serine/alanine adding enzyme
MVSVSSDVTESEWDDYVQRHAQSTVDHLWRWRGVLADVFGHRAEYLAARRDSQIVGVLPLVLVRSRIFGRSAVSLPFLNYGGVLADESSVGEALVQSASAMSRDFGASHLELRHADRTFPELPCREHKLALTRPLPATADELWSSLDRKVRNQVRKAQKEKLATVAGGTELLEEFYGIFSRNMRDLGTPVCSHRLFGATLAEFQQAKVFVVRLGPRALAAGISIRFRDTVLVPWASSLREYRHLCPNMLLYWAMLEDAIQGRAAVFDFGRSSPDSGTHGFKLQWGAVARPLHWEYVLLSGGTLPDHSPTNPKLQTAIRLWKAMPHSMASRLGPLIARHLA